MDLNYERCPGDDPNVISAVIQVPNSGESITLGLAEIVPSLSMKSSVYAITLAIKGGVENDFIGRCAVGLADQMGGDVHALCPVIQILCECFALMDGGKAVLDEDGKVSIFPSKQCPEWMRGYYTHKMED